MGVSMSTLSGWVVVLGIFGAYAFREWTKTSRAQLARTEAQRLRQSANLRRDAKEAKPKESKAKESKAKESKAKESKPKETKAKAPTATAQTTHQKNSPAYGDSSDDDAAKNREFARQITNIKQGTKFVNKTKDETRQKSVKQSRAEETPAHIVGRISAPSSTAGIDADDDRSSAAASPVMGPALAGNVDDMLEAPAPGPSVLRLTNTEEKTSSQAKKPKAAPAPTETKKQRQNRRKAELAKAERDAAEQERKTKLEAQRRAARVAEGRAAKDGSAFIAAQAKPMTSVWVDSSANEKVVLASSSASSGANGFVPVHPLDTFDTNIMRKDISKPAAASYNDKSDGWMSSLPSEEEQIELLRNEDSWSTVKTKSRKSKKQQDVAPLSDESAVVTPKPTAPYADKKPAAQVASQTSFSALTVDGVADDGEEEEEWDV